PRSNKTLMHRAKAMRRLEIARWQILSATSFEWELCGSFFLMPLRPYQKLEGGSSVTFCPRFHSAGNLLAEEFPLCKLRHYQPRNRSRGLLITAGRADTLRLA